MKNLKKRADFFELDYSFENQINFVDKVKLVKSISNIVSEHLGHTENEAEMYIQNNISEIVRENHVLNMLKRIERDLFFKDEDFVENSIELLKEISDKLKNS
jgi:hypothetical protein